MSENPRLEKVRTGIFTLPEGDAVLIFPDELSADSVNDLESYLALNIKRLRRRAERATASPEGEPPAQPSVLDPLR